MLFRIMLYGSIVMVIASKRVTLSALVQSATPPASAKVLSIRVSLADGNHDGSRLCERARSSREQRRGENNAENGINEAEKFRRAAVHAQSLDTSSGAQSLDGGPSDGEPAFSPCMQANSNPGVQQAPFARRI
jgi:hypothetical protein